MFFQMHVMLCSLWREDIFEGSAELEQKDKETA